MIFAQLFLTFVVAIPLILVTLNRLRADLAALLIAVILGLGQFLGLGLLGAEHTPQDAIKAFSGLSEPVVLTLLSLFIITQSLHKSGATRWIAYRLIDLGASSERRLIVLYATSTALLSLFMNNLAAGALLLPSAMETCRRTGIKPSKLLIPVAYGSLLGGSATYFTTANIIVNNLLASADPPQAMLHILDFTPTGGLIVLAGIAFLGLFGPRLLPDRLPPPELMIARYTSSDLEEYYQLSERLWEAVVLPDSKFANKSLAESRIGKQLGLAVAGVWHGRQAIFSPSPEQIIHPGDILLVVGREERVQQLTQMGMKIGREDTNNHISARGVSLIEALAAPHSQALGHTLREMEFRTRYGFTVLALSRDGCNYRTNVGDLRLKMGDSLVMIGSREKLKRLHNSPDFIVLEPDTSDQPVQRLQAGLTVGVIAHSDVMGKIVPFKIECIEQATLTTEQFSIPEAFDEDALLKYAWGIWSSDREPEIVRLKFAPGTATRRLKESTWHPLETVTDAEDGGCIWEAPIAEWQEMLPWIRGWGADCEVVGPRGLREALMGEAKAMAEKYGWEVRSVGVSGEISLADTFRDFFGADQ